MIQYKYACIDLNISLIMCRVENKKYAVYESRWIKNVTREGEIRKYLFNNKIVTIKLRNQKRKWNRYVKLEAILSQRKWWIHFKMINSVKFCLKNCVIVMLLNVVRQIENDLAKDMKRPPVTKINNVLNSLNETRHLELTVWNSKKPKGTQEKLRRKTLKIKNLMQSKWWCAIWFYKKLWDNPFAISQEQ